MTVELKYLTLVTTFTALIWIPYILWARVVHLMACTFAIPWVRTLAFAVGFGCQITIALQILR